MLNNPCTKKNIFVADIRAERLFREAEDDFFYLNNISSACEKIEQAMEYAPCMLKAILMRANIAFLDGDMESALTYYKKAENIEPDNAKVLAGLANVYEILNFDDYALLYTQKALAHLGKEMCSLKNALINLKSTILIKQKKYAEAKKIIETSRYFMTTPEIMKLRANNLITINKKLKLYKKIEKINLKLVK